MSESVMNNSAPNTSVMRTEEIAIVGLGCRFPGAENPDAFWRMLKGGEKAIRPVPPERWARSRYYDPDPTAAGKMSSCEGGFLDDIDRFDASFFGISEEEARHIDPQQRLFLEVAWEALEQAGIAPLSLSGSATGVFTGLCTIDYHRLLYRDFEAIGPHSGTGTTMSITANRLSYFLDLHGPSMAVDAACSSSLLSVHLACQSLRTGESNLCLAGGVNLILSPDSMISSSQTGLLSKKGECRPFDADADGYVRGEGCGVVVLKRLSDARREGDTVLAVIKGSAVNQDGLSNSMSAPNGLAQQALIKRSLAVSNVAPKDISYVEAHAVGTLLGDAIEFKALKKVLSADREGHRETPCIIGSLKPHIGHLEAASGMASLIKVVMALQHEEIPPQLNFEQANAYVDLEESGLEIARGGRKWKRGENPRTAGVSTFGFGGTNAHVVIGEAERMRLDADSLHCNLSPKADPVGVSHLACTSQTPPLRFPEGTQSQCLGATADLPSIGGMAEAQRKSGWVRGLTASHLQPQRQYLLPLTAKSPAALRALAQRYCEYLAKSDQSLANNQSLANICYTASIGRSAFNHRLCVVAGSVHELKQKLVQFLSGKDSNQYLVGRAKGRRAPKVIFSFPELTQRNLADVLKMGELFYRTRPAFKERLEQYVAGFDYSLSFAADAPAAENMGLAVCYAMSRLWQSWGVQPKAVMGKGEGEAVAALMAGLSETTLPSIPILSTQHSPFLQSARATLLENHSARTVDKKFPLTGTIGYDFVLSMGAMSGRSLLEKQSEIEPVILALNVDRDVEHQMLDWVGALFVKGVPVDWAALYQGELHRKVPLPTYPFERSSYWFSDKASIEETADGTTVQKEKMLIVKKG